MTPEPITPPPRPRFRWLKWTVLITFLTLALCALIAWQFTVLPEGWLRVPRAMTSAQLFSENGIPLENVEWYAAVQDRMSLESRFTGWRRKLSWRNPRTWIDFGEHSPYERHRAQFAKGADPSSDFFNLEPGMLVVWKHRRQKDPAWPPCRSVTDVFRYYPDISHLPFASLEEMLHARSGHKISSPFPEYLRVVRVYEMKSAKRHVWGVNLQVSDPKAWFDAATAIAVQEGEWAVSADNDDWCYYRSTHKDSTGNPAGKMSLHIDNHEKTLLFRESTPLPGMSLVSPGD